jgi:hypothetical protein
MAGSTSATEASLPADAPSEIVALPVDAGAPERRPGDIGRLILGVLGVVLAGLWAQTGNNVDVNLFKAIKDLPNAFEGVANVFAAFGSIWFVIALGRAPARPLVPCGA